MTRIAVLVGGRSSEHEISCISARSIVAALDGHDITIVGITRNGDWVGGTKDLESLLVVEGVLPHVDDAAPRVDVAQALAVDVVFPVLHGPWGEDGTVQGLLEMYSVPYVGSGVLASAISMDKGHMKAALRSAGLPGGDWVMKNTEGLFRPLRRPAVGRMEGWFYPRPSEGQHSEIPIYPQPYY